jgi:zinc and cadmium transporter
MPLPFLILLFCSCLFSGLTVFVIKFKNRQSLKLLLAFSGSYLFAVCILHLLPETYGSAGASIGIYILAGFLLQLLLEFISEGIEHGHIHVHADHEKSFPLAIMFSLCVHSFLEGMPLAGRDFFYSNRSLFWGIVLHNIPIAIALTTMLFESGISKRMAFLFLTVFALMAPLGSILSSGLEQAKLLNFSVYYNNIMGIVIGIFLHISTTILFESSENHRFNLIKFIAILFGAATAIALI